MVLVLSYLLSLTVKVTTPLREKEVNAKAEPHDLTSPTNVFRT
jgi:hypothetical protein